MSYVRPPVRQAISAASRSRHPQIHSSSCRCTHQPHTSELEFLRKENGLLRSRHQDESEKERRILIEDRLRVMTLENEKLHDRLLNYQITLEELEKTHLELVGMLKSQRGFKNLESSRGLSDSRRVPTKRSDGKTSDRRGYEVEDCEMEENLEGEYIVSLKRVKSREKKGMEEKQEGLGSSRKPGIKLSYEGGSVKKSYMSESPQRVNPEYNTKPQHKSNSGEKGNEQELLQLSEKIKFLETLLHERDEESTKLKSSNKTLQNQNQLLRLRIKNIEQNIKSYEESIKHYQSESTKLKKLLEEIRSKETSQSFTLKQNLSIRESNEYLKRQIEELQEQSQRQKTHLRTIKEELEAEKRKNLRLNLNSKELEMTNTEIEKLKRTIHELNLEVSQKQLEINKHQYDSGRLGENVSKEILEIKRVLQGIDLSTIEQEECRNILGYKTQCFELNHEVSSLNLDIRALKQRILLLEQKEYILVRDKEVLAASAEAGRRENEILLLQIQSLEASIEKYLDESALPRIRVSVEESLRSSLGDYQNDGLNQVKGDVQEIVQRLKALEGRLARGSQ